MSSYRILSEGKEMKWSGVFSVKFQRNLLRQCPAVLFRANFCGRWWGISIIFTLLTMPTYVVAVHDSPASQNALRYAVAHMDFKTDQIIVVNVINYSLRSQMLNPSFYSMAASDGEIQRQGRQATRDLYQWGRWLQKEGVSIIISLNGRFHFQNWSVLIQTL